jgi:hypothetical protein
MGYDHRNSELYFPPAQAIEAFLAAPLMCVIGAPADRSTAGLMRATGLVT